ncbi:Uncharacterized protein conserved in bacteria (DUF2179) [Mycoplasmopsis maculosa]|uniref:Uncharacterized protein conserved in bacteria (DUF2179) n=1 Tax=Mycoplasmopsis maculosa TaxID=114885 RepID=A0A449B481_9BACT|nr:DUF2179 domain-containing protein [Mycoplasmopsis maculosa]VEU75413.1 Uncharacterized protein conserved in bacteria (DUF2179) [Mycoplasmopsis maculosa]
MNKENENLNKITNQNKEMEKIAKEVYEKCEADSHNSNRDNDITIDQVLTGNNENISSSDSSYVHTRKQVIDKKNTTYKQTKLSNFVLKLSRFYALMPFWKLGLITAGLAILFGVVSVFLVKNPGIYNFGLAAFGQAISKLTVTLLRNNPEINGTLFNIIDHSLFWILYLVLSIPLFIFSWKKLGKHYTVLTLEFLVVSSLVSAAMGQIPAINNFTLFGVFNHPEITSEIKSLLQTTEGVKWTSDNVNNVLKLIPLQWSDGGNIIAQIIFAFVYGILLAYFFAIIAIMGGSAGVTGIIGEYLSIYKQKDFGTMNGYINIIIIVVSVLIGTYVPASLIAKDFKTIYESNAVMSEQARLTIKSLADLSWKVDFYISPNFISTFICNFVFVMWLNKLFPRFRIVQCKVYTHHLDEIRDIIINDQRTINNFTVTKGEGGYSGNKLQILSSITLYRQVPRLIKKIRSVDQNAFITITDVASVDGKLYIPEHKF